MLHKIKAEVVVFDKAVPAPRIQVFFWLVTGGKRGRLFERKNTEAITYTPPTGFNCRCASTPVIVEELQGD